MKDQVAYSQRIKRTISYLKGIGKITSQMDLGEKLGIYDKTYLSNLVNGRASVSSFIDKLTKLFPEIDENWLLTGEGNMLCELNDTAQNINGDNNTAVAGNGNLVNSDSLFSKVLDEIAAQRRIIESKDRQIERLITIIENQSKSEK